MSPRGAPDHWRLDESDALLRPALVAGDRQAVWLYILAPITGASLGGLAYQFVRGEQTQPAELQTDVEQTEQVG